MKSAFFKAVIVKFSVNDFSFIVLKKYEPNLSSSYSNLLHFQLCMFACTFIDTKRKLWTVLPLETTT